MRIDLVRLLSERELMHPSRVVRAELSGRELRIQVHGFPWWAPALDPGRERDIVFIFGGVGEGSLNLAGFADELDEALEELSVLRSAAVLWGPWTGASIYCGAPLVKPWGVYAIVHDILGAQGSRRATEQYLNGAASIREFLRITGSNGYLLGDIPAACRDAVCEELRRQGVPYTEHPPRFRPPGALLVQLLDSWFFCETAEAEFDG